MVNLRLVLIINQNSVIMSEEIIPDVIVASDVPETVENLVVEETAENANYSEMTLAEIVKSFEDLMADEERMKKSREAETLKSVFYKKLQKEKFDAGLTATDVVPAEQVADEQEVVEEVVETVADNPFAEVEKGFKTLYNRYRKEKAEYNRQLDKEREDNLAVKEQVIADLKNLIEKGEDVNATFPEFREIQNRWRAVGPVPAQNFRNINETYQLYVEQFYDMVKINRELRDLDFKKNLEAKEQFCQLAEQLAENSNVVEAFRELQKLHEQWKEYGPVAKEYREQIWDRFKAATAVINKKYQAFFEGLKEQQAENLAKKTVLCEKVEEIAAREVLSSNQWNAFSKEIEEVQKEWKMIGFASKKDNQKIYDRFRAACDNFYGRKREFYTEYKDSMNANLERKVALCEQAEALKTSTDWKKTTDQFIALQKQWKEIGAVPRKKSDLLWKRFRAACDEFFALRDKNAKPENDFYGNLRAKQALIAEIKAYELKGDASDAEAMQEFQKRWQEIGFVPFKEKDNVAKAYKEALQEKFPRNQLEQDVVTYENNIGFFSMSKNAEPLIKQMQERIAQAKAELETLAGQIRQLKETENQE